MGGAVGVGVSGPIGLLLRYCGKPSIAVHENSRNPRVRRRLGNVFGILQDFFCPWYDSFETCVCWFGIA